MQLGRYDEAEAQLLAAYSANRGANGDAANSTKKAAARLAALYDAWKKPARAEAFRRGSHP